MTVRPPVPPAAETVDILRAAGASFALLHGSRAAGTHRNESDVDADLRAFVARMTELVAPD